MNTIISRIEWDTAIAESGTAPDEVANVCNRSGVSIGGWRFTLYTVELFDGSRRYALLENAFQDGTEKMPIEFAKIEYYGVLESGKNV